MRHMLKASAAITVMLAGPASAQQLVRPAAGGQATEAAAPQDGIGDIVVTARRRDEALQDVPLAVTALSGDSLREASISSTADLMRVVPSLTVASSIGGGSTTTFGIRGQRNLIPRLGNDPSVGVYVNEVVQARPQGLNQSLYDLQSVQVLKGPQGTLFGRNTTGGAILFQSNRPVQRFEGSIEGEFGNYNDRAITGMLNVPVGEKLALRVAGRRQVRDGYVQNVLTGRELSDLDNYSFRISVLADLSDSLSNLTIYDHFKSDEDGSAFSIRDARPCPAGLAACFWAPGSPFGDIQAEVAAQERRGYHSNASQGPTFSRVLNRGVANITTLDLGGATIKNVFGYREIKVDDGVDFDGTPLAIIDVIQVIRVKQYSNELQLQGRAFDDQLEYILGAYYFLEKGTDIDIVTALDLPIPIAPGVFLNATNPYRNGGGARSESKSVFAQASYTLAPDLRITAGGRYTRDDRGARISSNDPLGCRFNRGEPATVAGLSPCLREASRDFGAGTWTVGVDYKLSSGTLIYLTSRYGYRAGGFNIGAESDTALFPGFGPEKVTDVEAGLKSDWHLGDIPVRTNAAFYYSWADDLQRSVRLAPGSAVNSTINAASGKIYGLEVEITARLTPDLTLSGFYNWDHARYDSFVSPAGDDFTDDRFSFTPEHKLGLKARYETSLGRVGNLSLQADYSWQSKIYFDDLNEPESVQKGYGLLNLRAELANIQDAGVDVALFARNVTKKEYAAGGQGFGASLGFHSINPGEPRMYGGQVRFTF